MAEILGLYVDHDIYFLARDAELLHDYAKLMFANDPKVLSRLHLLNVSRANMRAPHLKEYLAQEGLTEEALLKGKVLLVDTGFAGTIPQVIAENFSPMAVKNLKTHLICSSNPKHPSTTAFTNLLNPHAYKMRPSELHGTIIAYEHMPRFTRRASGFIKVEDRWEAMSPEGPAPEQGENQVDGVVWRSKAMAYMEDMKAWAQSKPIRSLFRKKFARWSLWRQLLDQKEKERLRDELQHFISTEESSGESLASIRDLIETTALHFDSALIDKDDLKALGVSEEQQIQVNPSTMTLGNKLQLAKEHPEWKAVLENPADEIKKLIEKGDWQTLGALGDTVDDYDFASTLIEAIAHAKSSSMRAKFVKSQISSEKNSKLLAERFFTSDNLSPEEDALADLVLEKLTQVEKGVIWQFLTNADIYRKWTFGALAHRMAKLIGEDNMGGALISKETLAALPKEGDFALILLPVAYGNKVRLGAKIVRSKNPIGDTPSDLLEVQPVYGNERKFWNKTLKAGLNGYSADNPESIDAAFEKIAPQFPRTKLHGSIMEIASKFDFERIRLVGATLFDGITHDKLNELFTKMIVDQVQGDLGLGPKEKLAEGLKPALASAKPKPAEPAAEAEQYTILKPAIASGKHGIIDLVVRNSDGKKFVCKRPKTGDAEDRASFLKELDRAKRWRELKLSQVEVFWHPNQKWLLKTYVEGPTLAESFHDPKFWKDGKNGKNGTDARKTALGWFLARAAATGIYVGDLNADNLIFDGKEWQIVDSGSIRAVSVKSKSFEKYRMKLIEKWQKALPKVGVKADLGALFESAESYCEALLSESKLVPGRGMLSP